jgi:hypothetical protein
MSDRDFSKEYLVYNRVAEDYNLEYTSYGHRRQPRQFGSVKDKNTSF